MNNKYDDFFEKWLDLEIPEGFFGLDALDKKRIQCEERIVMSLSGGNASVVERNCSKYPSEINFTLKNGITVFSLSCKPVEICNGELK